MNIHPVLASAIAPYLDEKETRRDRPIAAVCEQLALIPGYEVLDPGAIDTNLDSEGGSGQYIPQRENTGEVTTDSGKAPAGHVPPPRKGLHERESDGTMPFQFFSMDLGKTCSISRKRYTKQIGINTYAGSKGNTGSIPTEGVIIDKREEIGIVKKKAA